MVIFTDLFIINFYYRYSIALAEITSSKGKNGYKAKNIKVLTSLIYEMYPNIDEMAFNPDNFSHLSPYLTDFKILYIILRT